MSEEQHQAPLPEVRRPSRELPRRRVLRYFSPLIPIAVIMEWQYRTVGKFLESFPAESTQRRLGLMERFILKNEQDPFPELNQSEIKQAWWKCNIAQVMIQNELPIASQMLFNFLFNNGQKLDISKEYEQIILADPIYHNLSEKNALRQFITNQVTTAPKITVTNLTRDAQGKIPTNANIRFAVPADIQWIPSLQQQLRDHIIYIMGKVVSYKINQSQAPPDTGPPGTNKNSLLTVKDAQSIAFKQFSPQSVDGIQVSRQAIETFTSQILQNIPLKDIQNQIINQPWYQAILNSGFTLTAQDAKVLIESGNAKEFEIWATLPRLQNHIQIPISLDTLS